MMEKKLITCAPVEGVEGGHKVAVYCWGDPSLPAVVCVHGMTRNARDFDYLARALEQEYYVVAITMAGRGESDYLPRWEAYNYATYIQDIFSVLAALGIQQCKWVGTSMGGLIGMVIAATMPGVITRMVINDIGPLVPKEAMEKLASYVGRAPVFETYAAAEGYLQETYTAWNLTQAAHWQHLYEHSIVKTEAGFSLAYDPKIGQVLHEKEDGPEEINLWEYWEKVTCPVQLIWGQESDILPKEVVDQMLDSKPDMMLVAVADTGHVPSLMEEKQIEMIKGWLAA